MCGVACARTVGSIRLGAAVRHAAARVGLDKVVACSMSAGRDLRSASCDGGGASIDRRVAALCREEEEDNATSIVTFGGLAASQALPLH